jgi:hypothetical protein
LMKRVVNSAGSDVCDILFVNLIMKIRKKCRLKSVFRKKINYFDFPILS